MNKTDIFSTVTMRKTPGGNELLNIATDSLFKYIDLTKVVIMNLLFDFLVAYVVNIILLLNFRGSAHDLF